MIIFGGFNGEYYNDLYYINVFELRTKLQIPPSIKAKAFLKIFNRPEYSDCQIKSVEGITFYLHKGFLMNAFKNVQNMNSFIAEINGIWERELIYTTFMKIYQGYGIIS